MCTCVTFSLLSSIIYFRETLLKSLKAALGEADVTSEGAVLLDQHIPTADDKSQPQVAPEDDLGSGGLGQLMPVTIPQPLDSTSLFEQETAALLLGQLAKHPIDESNEDEDEDEDDKVIKQRAGDDKRQQLKSHHDKCNVGGDHVDVSEEEIRDQFNLIIENADIGDMVNKEILAELEAGRVLDAFCVSSRVQDVISPNC